VVLYNNNTVIIVETQEQNKKTTTITTNSITCSVCRNNYTDIITDSESGEVICGMAITEKSEDVTNPILRIPDS
jgi:hypothetical protein